MSITWTDDKLPYAAAFDDHYYSIVDGLSESRHVFLAGNRLEARFAELQPSQVFTIGELGFGTGLNFLALLQLWQQVVPAKAQLVYHSLEANPLTMADLAKAHANWPELAAVSENLCQYYNQALQAPVAWGNVTLNLHVGSVDEVLADFPDDINAWFLDGFAPARNPAMWAQRVMAAVGAKAAPGATFATYTAASQVRRDLQAAGFNVSKVKGFGTKREMLVGEKSA